MDKNRSAVIKRSFKAAFPPTIPIMTGFLFLGMTYGIYMRVSGFGFIYPAVMSVVIFGGSLEFVAVQMLLSPFAPLQTLIMTLMIQARHIFYGLAMLGKFKDTGKFKPYLIYGMCDETFSIICSAEIPKEADRIWFMFFVTALDQLYWFAGAAAGGLLGGLISVDIKGLDFVMTAMFAVIFLEQLLKEKKHYTAIIGTAASVICLIVFGADTFMIPTMISIILLLTVFRKKIEGQGQQ